VVYIYTGFYGAQQALLAATGLSDVDLTQCVAGFTGGLLALCQDTQAREEAWVNFKLFGMMGMTIAFVIAQAFYLARHIKDSEPVAEAD
jgi:intracellular septation protein